MEAIHAVQRAIDYIEAHLGEHIESERIAAAAYMSLPHLYRIFYAATGHTVMDYIRKRRISQAADALRHSRDPVLDIALQSGFESYRTFASSFKRSTGVTPGMYRRADSYFSFERAIVRERVHYAEDRELTGRYPDVRVIRVAPMRMIVYRHRSRIREGLEEEAFRIFYRILAAAGLAMQRTRLFGSELASGTAERSGMHEYVMMTPDETRGALDRPELSTMTLPGGLYAVSPAPAGPGATIVAVWNRMVAEWLPRSRFALGNHPFIEEYHHYRGAATRLKLFLPVTRKSKLETIDIVELPPARAIVFRAAGTDAQSVVDEKLTAWLTVRGMAGDASRALYMSCSYGSEEDEQDGWYELGVDVTGDADLTPDVAASEVALPGGWYACMTTDAYGVMTGVLAALHDWLLRNGDYRLDDKRTWFARYAAGAGDDPERSTTVTCCVPIIRRRSHDN